jgi:hypothetical protein
MVHFVRKRSSRPQADAYPWYDAHRNRVPLCFLVIALAAAYSLLCALNLSTLSSLNVSPHSPALGPPLSESEANEFQFVPHKLMEALAATKHSVRQADIDENIPLWQEEGRVVYPAFALLTPDTCPADAKQSRRVRERLIRWKGQSEVQPNYLAETGIWQDVVNDKLGQVFFVHHLAREFPDAGLTFPRVYACTDNFDAEWLKNYQPGILEYTTGYVVKDLHGWSAHGVYIFPNGFGSTELLSGQKMTKSDVSKSLTKLKVTAVSIEEYIPKPLTSTVTPDYKFHVNGEKILSIHAAFNRGHSSACFAFFDVNWNRLDFYGGFFDDGGPEAPGTVKAPKHESLCGYVPKPALLPQLIDAAKLFGKSLGIFYRVDLYIHPVTSAIVLGEFTPWPWAGGQYFWSRFDETTGFDQCAPGREWLTETTIGLREGYDGPPVFEGGIGAVKPHWVDAFVSMNFSEKCANAVKFSEVSRE